MFHEKEMKFHIILTENATIFNAQDQSISIMPCDISVPKTVILVRI